jgi:hypothetical protein
VKELHGYQGWVSSTASGTVWMELTWFSSCALVLGVRQPCFRWHLQHRARA